MSESSLSRLAALLDYETPPWPAGLVPPLGHWLGFLPYNRQSDIGIDGHPRKGGFLPPVALPRRVSAGGSITFHNNLPIDTTATRMSTIRAIESKVGSAGPVVFVKIKHEISIDGAVIITELQDLAYREAPTLSAGVAAKNAPLSQISRPSEYQRRVTMDATQLFRFSALTFNAHRIHYDREYASQVEGYPGLIVHGPFAATLLVNFFQALNPRARIIAFHFRAERPLFDTGHFELHMRYAAGGADLWIMDQQHQITMTAKIESER